MALRFKSLRSSSSGNSLLLWTESTKILIDCGLGSMKKTKTLLNEAVDDISSINTVLISHTHTDHISHYPLRVIEDAGLPLMVYEKSISQMKNKHFNNRDFSDLVIEGFDGCKFEINDIVVHPFKVPHQPDFSTFGFLFEHKFENRWQKVAVATDFHCPDDLMDYFKDTDFIFLESNHDLEMLRNNFNPNSRYHLSNINACKFLYDIQSHSHTNRRKIMLGHLSKQRNTPNLALEQVKSFFGNNNTQINFELLIAPESSQSSVIEIH